MDLTIDQLDRHLLSIFTGMATCRIENKFIQFKHPNNITKMKANDVYEDALERAKSEGMLTTEKLEALIKERNLFTDRDQKVIKSLDDKINAQQILLAKTTKVRANMDRIKNIIAGFEKQRNELLHKKYSKLAMSAETKAEEERTLYLCWASTYDENGVLYWIEYADFLTEKDTIFRNKILEKFLVFYRGIETSIIRYIARSSLWRIRYVTSQKTSEPLFGVPTSDYTNDMVNLAYWSNFYQNIYEMMPEDRPSDMIIEDDEALDSYMKDYYEERSREDAVKRGGKSTKGKLSAFDSEEVIVTQSNELYEDIKYDKPREAQMLKNKEKTDLRKRVRRKRG